MFLYYNINVYTRTAYLYNTVKGEPVNENNYLELVELSQRQAIRINSK